MNNAGEQQALAGWRGVRLMAGVRERFLGLCLTPLAFAMFDGCLTLAGQPDAYWDKTYAAADEVSPTFNHLLMMHPLAFVGGSLVYMSLFVGIILLLPDTLALMVGIALTFGHVGGASTWLWRSEYGYQAVNGLYVLAAAALALGIRWGWKAGPSQEYRLPSAVDRWRWALSIALLALGVYLFLWPRSV